MNKEQITALTDAELQAAIKSINPEGGRWVERKWAQEEIARRLVAEDARRYKEDARGVVWAYVINDHLRGDRITYYFTSGHAAAHFEAHVYNSARFSVVSKTCKATYDAETAFTELTNRPEQPFDDEEG